MQRLETRVFIKAHYQTNEIDNLSQENKKSKEREIFNQINKTRRNAWKEQG